MCPARAALDLVKASQGIRPTTPSPLNLILVGQEDRRGGPPPLFVVGLGDDPEALAAGGGIGRQEAGAVAGRLVVEAAVLIRDIAPITAKVHAQ